MIARLLDFLISRSSIARPSLLDCSLFDRSIIVVRFRGSFTATLLNYQFELVSVP